MARKRKLDPKAAALAETRTLNPRPETVRDEQFGSSEFFDARDVVQVKYEMVRRVRVDGAPVTAAAAAFGFSRPSFYEAAAACVTGAPSTRTRRTISYFTCTRSRASKELRGHELLVAHRLRPRIQRPRFGQRRRLRIQLPLPRHPTSQLCVRAIMPFRRR